MPKSVFVSTERYEYKVLKHIKLCLIELNRLCSYNITKLPQKTTLHGCIPSSSKALLFPRKTFKSKHGRHHEHFEVQFYKHRKNLFTDVCGRTAAGCASLL